MKVIALTGGIGCGKSVVAAMFRDLGAPTLDADQVSRDVVEPGTPGYNQILDLFGNDVLCADGGIDRAKLRDVVFRNEAARRDLEAIIHPLVFQRIAEWIAECAQRNLVIIAIEIPLLFEVDTPDVFHATVAVVAPRATQISRVVKRTELDAAAVERVVAAQMDPYEKAKRADHVVDNSGDLDRTRQQVVAIFHALTASD
ncbi:MAG: dephospho-CoA kinase [Candidatus Lernaella stagnicola]|nr:dephospho-CoA kinase [Candidatus Lernaella stagnicola]